MQNDSISALFSYMFFFSTNVHDNTILFEHIQSRNNLSICVYIANSYSHCKRLADLIGRKYTFVALPKNRVVKKIATII